MLCELRVINRCGLPVLEELADVLLYCGYLASDLDLDISEIVTEKLERNDRKYPIDKAYGTAKKYTEL